MDEDSGRMLFQTAYHGSSREFAEFSMDYAGTGAGSANFGYGIYASESRKVAEGYAESLGASANAKKEDVQHYQEIADKRRKEADEAESRIGTAESMKIIEAEFE